MPFTGCCDVAFTMSAFNPVTQSVHVLSSDDKRMAEKANKAKKGKGKGNKVHVVVEVEPLVSREYS